MPDYPTMIAFVVTVSPLTITVPGAITAVPAQLASGVTVNVNDRVTISVRTPQRPLVTQVESEA